MNEKVFLQFLQKRIVEISGQLNSYFQDLGYPSSHWYESYGLRTKSLYEVPDEYFRKLVYDVLHLESVSLDQRTEFLYKQLREDLSALFASLSLLTQEKSSTYQHNYYRVNLIREIQAFRTYIESRDFKAEINVYLEYLLKLNGVVV